jgi:hypothetical protein
LERRLNAEHKDRRFKVINAACPGHTTYQGLILLKEKLLKFDPDMLIVAYNNDPGLEYIQEKERAFKSPFVRELNKILYQSDYYLLFQRTAADFKLFLLTMLKKRDEPKLVRRVSLEDYSENIREFGRISNERDIRILFVKMPVNLEAFETFPFLKELFFDEQYRSTLTDICSRYNYLLVDVGGSWPMKKGQGLFEIVEHNGRMGEAHFHPSAQGHRRLAEQLYEAIARGGLIN